MSDIEPCYNCGRSPKGKRTAADDSPYQYHWYCLCGVLSRTVIGASHADARQFAMSFWNSKMVALRALSKEAALYIRTVRSDPYATWRVVSVMAAKRFPDLGIVSDSQPEGRALCAKAAIVLGEDPATHPWN